MPSRFNVQTRKCGKSLEESTKAGELPDRDSLSLGHAEHGNGTLKEIRTE
jgi:hypothetical protein